MNGKRPTQTALACIAAAGTIILSATSFGSSTNLNVSAGVDVRLRYDGTDNLPTTSRRESVPSDYARIRIRPWIKAEYQDIGMFVRLACRREAPRREGVRIENTHSPLNGNLILYSCDAKGFLRYCAPQ